MRREVFFIFRDGKHFFQRFLKKGFGHVTILQRDAYNWMQVDHYNDGCCIKIPGIASDNMQLIESHIMQCNTVLKICYKIKHRNIFSLSIIHPINCVSMAKYFLGVKNSCLTPYGLYIWLLSGGNKQIINVEKL
jgi:hypothetical protein